MSSLLDLSFYERSAVKLAPALLGCVIEHFLDSEWLSGMIVETEAYTEDDEASHSYRGRTARNEAMFARAGTIYVYTSYGMHRCMNISSGAEGRGEAVLLRSIWPISGVERMRQLRRWPDPKPLRDLTNGPGKLTAALGIGLEHNGLLLGRETPIRVRSGIQVKSGDVIVGPRIGITKAVDTPWRFRLEPSVFRR